MRKGTSQKRSALRRSEKPKTSQSDDSVCQAVVNISERGGTFNDQAHGVFATGVTRSKRRVQLRGNRRWMITALKELERPMIRQSLAALGHSMRVRMLAKLLDGPMVYQALKKWTRLKPGPLYYHINQLRLGGLINPKERNLYELTRGGRNLILLALAAQAIIVDRRGRPVGAAQ